MVIAPLIERKRDGGALDAGGVAARCIQAFATGEVPDYQMSALAMAVVFRGLEPTELDGADRRDARLRRPPALGRIPVPRVDKHSTGGVGDKTSLLLVPLRGRAAALPCR